MKTTQPRHIELDRELSDRVNTECMYYFNAVARADKNTVARCVGYRDTLLGRPVSQLLTLEWTERGVLESARESYDMGKRDAQIWMQTNNWKAPK